MSNIQGNFFNLLITEKEKGVGIKLFMDRGNYCYIIIIMLQVLVESGFQILS